MRRQSSSFKEKRASEANVREKEIDARAVVRDIEVGETWGPMELLPSSLKMTTGVATGRKE